MKNFDRDIIVLGAGVTGLTTAVLLKQKGYRNVTVVAKFMPGEVSIEYTSPFAGAHWRTMASNDNKLLQKFDAVSYKKFTKLACDNQNGQHGIMIAPSFDYYEDASAPEVSDPWFKDVVEDFQFLTREKDKLPWEAQLGHKYTTILINAPVYLQWLLSQFKAMGGNTIKRAISHIEELHTLFSASAEAKHKGEPLTVINCTGLGSRFLGGVRDKALYPSRGQTVIVKGPRLMKTVTYLGKQGITYVIPRSDGTIVLGGTAGINEYIPFADDETTQQIPQKAIHLCPELAACEHGQQMEIVRCAVGLRPVRKGGPRIENEIITSRDGSFKLRVTHAYGHGGFGFQASWGAAEHTIEVLEQGLRAENGNLSLSNERSRL